jgi:diaminopimelate epimerase
MQGAGNDYIYVNGFAEEIKNPAMLVVKLSDRHFGVGADGLIILQPSEVADFKMKMYNADGSEGAMCGNGIRCAVHFAMKYGIVKGKTAVVETAAGIRHVRRENDGFLVDMGQPLFLTEQKKPDISEIPGVYETMSVSMGNPHFVIFVANLDDICVSRTGPLLEHAPQFKDGANIEFVQILDETHMKLCVWERGSGETLACGTGTCAAVAAALKSGLMMNEHVVVCNPGGTLEVIKKENTLWLFGPAEFVFEGIWEP